MSWLEREASDATGRKMVIREQEDWRVGRGVGVIRGGKSMVKDMVIV